MNLRPQKRIAADILGVGIGRVWIDPNVEEDLSLALTREDIRKLITDGIIKKNPIIGVSRGRARRIALKKKRGLRRGQGSRKGKAGARTPKKRTWINKVRSQRRYLSELREKELIPPSVYRELYLKVKGNAYRNVSHLRLTVEEMGIIKKPKTRRR